MLLSSVGFLTISSFNQGSFFVQLLLLMIAAMVIYMLIIGYKVDRVMDTLVPITINIVISVERDNAFNHVSEEYKRVSVLTAMYDYIPEEVKLFVSSERIEQVYELARASAKVIILDNPGLVKYL
jgi:hypothetical protein